MSRCQRKATGYLVSRDVSDLTIGLWNNMPSETNKGFVVVRETLLVYELADSLERSGITNVESIQLLEELLDTIYGVL